MVVCVGENIKYLIKDNTGRPLACALFGSAAWKCAARDTFIGWESACRERNLFLLTNNTRFLVLPWVRVPCLASHILSRITRRIRADWQAKYGHPLSALETFVDRDRFRGTCYQAANWVRVGQTQGRTRNDRYSRTWSAPYPYSWLPQAPPAFSGRYWEEVRSELSEAAAVLP